MQVDAPATCYGHPMGLARVCVGRALEGSLQTGQFVSTDGQCAPESPAGTCALVATNITVPRAMTTVVGTKPLVLVATDTLTIDGTLRVQAGRNFSTCENHPGSNDVLMNGGGGGGAGGSFWGHGGEGGGGADSLTPPSGQNAASGKPTMLRGGCPGSNGGHGIPNGPANGGAGGGAVYLIAGRQIIVRGMVNASGSPGLGGNAVALQGGGGAGSGGLIGLDAPLVRVELEGSVMASGAGGGAGYSLSTDGANGGEAELGIRAPGGAGAGVGFGGDGSTSTNPPDGLPGGYGQSGTGGGGGGGGGGYVLVFAASSLLENVVPEPFITR